MIVDLNPPEAGASLASVVTNGVTPLTVYSDSGLTAAVSLPLALSQRGATTVYLAPGGQWQATVLSASGGLVWRGGGQVATGESLTLRSVQDDDEATTALFIDGGTP